MDPITRYQVYDLPPLDLLAFLAGALLLLLLADFSSFRLAPERRLHYDSLAFFTIDHQNYDFYQDFDSISIVTQDYYSYAAFADHLASVYEYMSALDQTFLANFSQARFNATSHLLSAVSAQGRSYNSTFLLGQLLQTDFRGLLNSYGQVTVVFLLDQQGPRLYGYQYTVLEQLAIRAKVLTSDDFSELQNPNTGQLTNRQKPHVAHFQFAVTLESLLALYFIVSAVAFLWELRLMHFMAERWEEQANRHAGSTYRKYGRLLRQYDSNKAYAAKYGGVVSSREEKLAILRLSGKRWQQLSVSERLTVFSYYSVYALVANGANMTAVLVLKFGGRDISYSALMTGLGVLAFAYLMQVFRYLQHVKSPYILNYNLKSVGFWLVRMVCGVGPILAGWVLVSYLLYRDVKQWGHPLLILEDFLENLFQYGIYETYNYKEGLLFYFLYTLELFFVLYLANNIMLAIFCAFATESLRHNRMVQYFRQSRLICPACDNVPRRGADINLTPIMSPLPSSPALFLRDNTSPALEFKYSVLEEERQQLSRPNRLTAKLEVMLNEVEFDLQENAMLAARTDLGGRHLKVLRHCASRVQALAARL